MITPQMLHVGASGWHYAHWRGPFYPQDLSADNWLGYYAEHLATVEINNSFYHLPKAETLRAWRSDTPDRFLFAVKASRYITHMKKLKDPADPLTTFLRRVDELADKLGPILFQLPPNWGPDLDRLRSFLQALPSGYRFAFEFRDQSWFSEGVYEALIAHNAALCIHDHRNGGSPRTLTADWTYVRLHGPDGAYGGKYSTETLAGWMGAFSTWMRQGKEVYCYLNNDMAGYAVQNALALHRMAEDGDGS